MSPTATTAKSKSADESKTAESKMTEAEFLDAQAAEAGAAVHHTWNELKDTLRETATLDVWARRHPWIVAGTAVAGGFLIATTLLRPKPEERDDAVGEDVVRPATPQRGSSWLVETLFSLLKPVLGQLVTALVAAVMGAAGVSMSEPAGEQEHDGPDAEHGGGRSSEDPVPT